MVAAPSQLELSGLEEPVSLSEIISALSFALDLTEGAQPGHAIRTCLLGMRIGEEAGVPDELKRALYYALLLKDVGCSSNAARVCAIVGGDDRTIKACTKRSDWNGGTILRTMWKNVLPEKNAVQRAVRLAKISMRKEQNHQEYIALRCDRGASIVRKLDVDEFAAEAVYHLDERWDGSGYPNRLRGEAIPILSRICALAQSLDVFSSESGPDAAIRVAAARSGKWFDPALVRAAESLHASKDLWRFCGTYDHRNETRRAVLDLDPAPVDTLPPDRIDTICEAFSNVVDAKSPYTYRHSMGVTDAAESIAVAMGMRGSQLLRVRRGALLHDLGKLSVPNTILDKQGRLTAREWDVMLEHPTQTRSILDRIRAFRDLSIVASQHHEKLDGSGYPWGLRAQDLTVEARLLAVADIYGALAEDRPYRAGMDADQIISIMSKDVGHKLDADCFDALCSVLDRTSMPKMPSFLQEPNSTVLPQVLLELQPAECIPVCIA